jgi:hypothetical protein
MPLPSRNALTRHHFRPPLRANDISTAAGAAIPRRFHPIVAINDELTRTVGVEISIADISSPVRSLSPAESATADDVGEQCSRGSD